MTSRQEGVDIFVPPGLRHRSVTEGGGGLKKCLDLHDVIYDSSLCESVNCKCFISMTKRTAGVKNRASCVTPLINIPKVIVALDTFWHCFRLSWYFVYLCTNFCYFFYFMVWLLVLIILRHFWVISWFHIIYCNINHASLWNLTFQYYLSLTFYQQIIVIYWQDKISLTNFRKIIYFHRMR